MGARAGPAGLLARLRGAGRRPEAMDGRPAAAPRAQRSRRSPAPPGRLPGQGGADQFRGAVVRSVPQRKPSIQRLKEKLAGRPFVVLAVNLDEPESRILKFLAPMKTDFTVLLDPERKTARAWQARILPASYV